MTRLPLARPAPAVLGCLTVIPALTAAVIVGAPLPAQGAVSTNWADQGISTGIKGVDVSLWQHGYPTPMNFATLKANGVRFAFIKSSDGHPKADAQAAKWWAIDRPAAHAAGLVVGTYHFAQLTSDPSLLMADARAEARLAAARTKKYKRGYLATALDIEGVPRNLTRAQVTSWALRWLRTYQRITGRTPHIYASRWLAESWLIPSQLGQYPLWLAAYGKGYPRPRPVRGWPASAPRFWQFTGSGQVPGSGSPRIDLNVFLGSPAQLRAIARLPKRKAPRFGL